MTSFCLSFVCGSVSVSVSMCISVMTFSQLCNFMIIQVCLLRLRSPCWVNHTLGQAALHQEEQILLGLRCSACPATRSAAWSPSHWWCCRACAGSPAGRCENPVSGEDSSSRHLPVIIALPDRSMTEQLQRPALRAAGGGRELHRGPLRSFRAMLLHMKRVQAAMSIQT